MRIVVLVTLVSACTLGEAVAPEPPPAKQCMTLDEALSGTRQALREGAFETLGLVVEDLLVLGRISAPLAERLGAVDQVEPYVGGNRLRPALGSALTLLREHPPVALVDALASWSRAWAEDATMTVTILDFVLAAPSRLAVVNPIRRMLTECGEGRPLAQALADLTGTQTECGLAASCLVREVLALAEDPSSKQALASLSFEGEEGRKAFGLLVARLMDATAQPGFDANQWRQILRERFSAQLPESTLQRMDLLVGLLGSFNADEGRRSNWREVVRCTERHDSQRTVPGLVYDLIMGDELDTVDLAAQLREAGEGVDGAAVYADLHQWSLALARRDDLRLPLNAVTEPLVTVPVARLLLERLRDWSVRGLVAEWMSFATKGLPCDTL